MARGPVLFDLEKDAGPRPSVAEAAPVLDFDTPDGLGRQGQAMQIAARLAARKPSLLSRLFWGLGGVLVAAMISLAAWQFITGLMTRYPLLGTAMSVLMVCFIAVLALIALREAAAFGRLGRLDGLRHAATQALAQEDLAAARGVTQRLGQLYKGREDTRWGFGRLAELQADQMDAGALLGLAEAQVLAPLDLAAQREVEAAARQVATVTALVPIALADVAAALTSNLRMIRRIAEIYGGRSGFFGSWRLTRAVLSHLVATGAVAVGDGLLEPFLGGSVLGKISRRFGEGVVNAALTARVGVAAMEVCRPLPFTGTPRPRVRAILGNALSGLFGRSGKEG